MSWNTLVVVTGSREWRGQQCLEIMNRELRAFDAMSSVLLHGNQSGADRMAHDLVIRELGWRASIPVPYMSSILGHELGKRGGPARNEMMERIARTIMGDSEEMVVHCVAFPMPGSRGTWDCVNRFRKWTIVKVVRDMLQQERSNDV